MRGIYYGIRLEETRNDLRTQFCGDGANCTIKTRPAVQRIFPFACLSERSLSVAISIEFVGEFPFYEDPTDVDVDYGRWKTCCH
jgi:hypothetical protein